jgi:hypothetical protein
MFWRMMERETWMGKVGLGWQEQAGWRGIRVCQVEVSPVKIIMSKPTSMTKEKVIMALALADPEPPLT